MYGLNLGHSNNAGTTNARVRQVNIYSICYSVLSAACAFKEKYQLHSFMIAVCLCFKFAHKIFSLTLGWTTTFGSQSCLPPQENVDPCVANGDPCMTANDPSNTCTRDADHVGFYYCTCNAIGGFAPGEASRICLQCEVVVGNLAHVHCFTRI